MIASLPTRTTPRIRLEGIESLRSYAAIAVILFHMVWVGGVTAPDYLSFVGTHFAQGVPLFFVVSGFSLAYGYQGRLDSQQSIAHYLIRRIARIAPLFYTILLFKIVTDHFASHRWIAPSDILINLTFLFNLMPTAVEGIAPASWTIGVEMLFYAIFPLALFACRNLRCTAVTLLTSIALAAAVVRNLEPLDANYHFFVEHNLVVELPFFLFGVLFCQMLTAVSPRVPEARRRLIGRTSSATALVLIIALYQDSSLYTYFESRHLRPIWEALWGLPFGMVCLGVSIHPTRVISNVVTRYLGKISFSLYLVHPFALWELRQHGVYGMVSRLAGNTGGMVFAGCAVTSLAVITAIAALTFRWIEQPGMRAGKRIANQAASLVVT